VELNEAINIRGALFDAVGTLIHPDPPVTKAYWQTGRRFGSRLDDLEIGRRFEEAWAAEEARDTELDHRTDEQRERERWRNIVGRVLDDVTDQEGLFAALWDHFASPAHWAMFPDVAESWQRLESAGLKLGVASNFDRRLLELCKWLPPLERAEPVVVSSLVGRRKPHREFFEKAAATMKLPPEQILFVGDSLEHDYRPALAAGFAAVLLNRDPRPMEGDGVTVASSLKEIAV
jgi:putative hydrolase of the HAD superfamily